MTLLDEYHERDRQRVETGGGLDDLVSTNSTCLYYILIIIIFL